MSISARERALKILYDVDNGAFSDAAVKNALSMPIEQADRRLITEMVYGVIANRTRLDYIMAHYSNLPLRRVSYWIKNILRLGIYQLLFLDKIPENAAVNECVKLAKRYGHVGSVGFVNGVLRSVASGGDVEYPDDPAIIYSHPQWLVDMWTQDYGSDFAQKLLQMNNRRVNVTIRPNRLKITSDELIDRLRAEHITVNQLREDILEISNFGSMERMNAFQEGLFTAQGSPSADAVLALNPHPGDLVIDVCAAPGGKATYAAELMQNQGKVIAFDLHDHKIPLIQANTRRLGIDIIEAHQNNSAKIRDEYINKADRVLVDAPCSGLGVIGKKPDIKWRKSIEDIEALVETQQQILSTSSRYLKSGGTLVYATCTISLSENNGVVDWFLSNHDGYEKIAEKQYYPHIDHTNGFYIATLRKS